MEGGHAEVDLEAREGNGNRRRDVEHVNGDEAEGDDDDGEAGHLLDRRQAERAFLGNLRRVVDEAEQARQQRGCQDEQQARVRRVNDEDGQAHHQDDDDAAHGGRALLDQMALGAVGAHLLADLAMAQQLDEGRHHGHGQRHRDDEGQKQHEGRVMVEHAQH